MRKYPKKEKVRMKIDIFHLKIRAKTNLKRKKIKIDPNVPIKKS
jgi:hypothetical protein